MEEGGRLGVGLGVGEAEGEDIAGEERLARVEQGNDVGDLLSTAAFTRRRCYPLCAGGSREASRMSAEDGLVLSAGFGGGEEGYAAE